MSIWCRDMHYIGQSINQSCKIRAMWHEIRATKPQKSKQVYCFAAHDVNGRVSFTMRKRIHPINYFVYCVFTHHIKTNKSLEMIRIVFIQFYRISLKRRTRLRTWCHCRHRHVSTSSPIDAKPIEIGFSSYITAIDRDNLCILRCFEHVTCGSCAFSYWTATFMSMTYESMKTYEF